MENIMAKCNSIEVKRTYYINTDKYVYSCSEDGNTYTSPASLEISEEEYLTLKYNGVSTEEYTEIALCEQQEEFSGTIKQLIFKHVAYVDKISHIQEASH